MRVAVITMARDESLFLQLWINHYGRHFGRENLYVVDHGSNDGSTLRCDVSVIRLPATELNEGQRTIFISRQHFALLCYYDWVIYTDVDEFLVPDPACFGTLGELIADCKHPVIAGIGLNVLHDTRIEGALDFEESILAQRKWVQFDPMFCKPAISRVPMRWQAGFHNVTETRVYLSSNLYMFHLKSVDWSVSHSNKINRSNIKLSELDVELGQSLHFKMSKSDHDRIFFSSKHSLIDAARVSDFRFTSDVLDYVAGKVNKTEVVGAIDLIPNRFSECIPGLKDVS